MKTIKDLVHLSDEESNLLKQNYIKKLNDKNFLELINVLNTTDDILMQYTSQLEEASIEFNNCRGCNKISECKNKVKGYVYTPKVDQNKIIFSYIACNYKQKLDYDTKYQENVYLFESPKKVKEASLKSLYRNDKNRVEFMKYVNTFVEGLLKNTNPKGIYLHGSYGTGKTYLIAALFNELAKKILKVQLFMYRNFYVY